MMNVVLPAGTVSAAGSHPVSVTATATSGLATGVAGVAGTADVFSAALGAGVFSPQAAKVKEAAAKQDAVMSLNCDAMIVL